MTPFTFGILEGDDCVICKDDVENQTGKEEPSMAILQN
jgi:hypothetical protein